MLHDRQPRGDEQRLHHIFVHARCRSEHARAYVRHVCQLEQTLNRSILAKGSMQHRKNYVHVDGAIAGPPRERSIHLKRDEATLTMHGLRRDDYRFSPRQYRPTDGTRPWYRG